MLTAPDSAAAPSAKPGLLVPKWPFIVGDALLLVVALAMSTTAGSLNETQMLFCLGAVGLGGILLATPYVLEAFPPAAWSIFSGGGSSRGAAPEGLTEGELRRQARAAAEAVEQAARANAALEASARRFDARFAPLAELQKNLEGALTELREAAAARASIATTEAQAMQREFDRLRKEHAEKFKAAEAKITALEETLTVIASHLKTMVAPPAAEPVAPSRTRAKAAVSVAEEAPAPAHVGEPALVAAGGEVTVAESPSLGSLALAPAEPIQNFTPAPAVEPAPMGQPATEPDSLLAKALATAQPAAESPAVSGIIQSRPRRARKSKPHLPLDAVTASAEETPAVPAIPAEPVAEAVTAEPAPEIKTEPVAIAEMPVAPEVVPAPPAPAEESGSALRRSARAKAIALRGEDDEEQAGTPTIFTPPPADDAATPQADGPTQGELLAREAETIRRKRATKSPLNMATLTAHVLIGIGNKPFVRGEGPGLSSDQGVPMEFVEIGQWRWVAPKESSAPITLRILKNDEIPAEGEPIVLKPGQAIEVRPVFPA